jgi:hypothetical protein
MSRKIDATQSATVCAARTEYAEVIAATPA